MAKKNLVRIEEEVGLAPDERGYRLTFQKCVFEYENVGDPLPGFRFIWRLPSVKGAKGRLQTARGQARIPTERELFALLKLAADAGWFVGPEKWASLAGK